MIKEEDVHHDTDGQLIETSPIDCTATERARMNIVSFVAVFWHVTQSESFVPV